MFEITGAESFPSLARLLPPGDDNIEWIWLPPTLRVQGAGHYMIDNARAEPILSSR